MMRRLYLCLSIDGFIRNNRYPKGYRNMFSEDGRTLAPAEVRSYLAIEKDKGHEVIPMSSECGSPCKHAADGCTGFDYSGKTGGCPGYTITAEEAA